MEAQLRTLTERNNELSQKLGATGESNRIITHAMRLKQEELQNLAIRHDALTRQLKDREAQLAGNPSADSKEEKETLTLASGMPLELLLMTHTVRSQATSSSAPVASEAEA